MGKRQYELIIAVREYDSGQILSKENLYPVTKEQIQEIAKNATIKVMGFDTFDHFDELEE